MTIFFSSDIIFLKVLFYILMIFFGLFEAKVFASDKKITKNTMKYYIVSLSSFVISALLYTTVSYILLYRLLSVLIIYGIWRRKHDNPFIIAVSLIIIQIYMGVITLLIIGVTTLLLDFSPSLWFIIRKEHKKYIKNATIWLHFLNNNVFKQVNMYLLRLA